MMYLTCAKQYTAITPELYQLMSEKAKEYVARNHSYRVLARRLLRYLSETDNIISGRDGRMLTRGRSYNIRNCDMIPNKQRNRILFFIGSFKGGGKERRLVELLSYLTGKDNYEIMVVVTDPIVDFPAFHQLKVLYRIIPKTWKKNDLTVFYKFYKLCKQFKPHLIHTWGRIQSFYALPAVIGLRIPLLNGQITSAPPHANRWSLNKMIDRINFKFSTVILSNSRAGIDAYKPPLRKIKIIYNGISLSRFENLPAPDKIRSKYGIRYPVCSSNGSHFFNQQGL